MAVKGPRSPFVKASLFMLIMIGLGTVILFAVPDRAELVLVVIWLFVVGAGSLLMRCPKCGKSLFMRGMFVTPWPAASCSRCGTDLTAVGTAE